MTAATMESHHIWSKSGICEKTISATPKRIMYGLLELRHACLLRVPLAWKQSALLIALRIIEE
jgi:hypothetical protein